MFWSKGFSSAVFQTNKKCWKVFHASHIYCVSCVSHCNVRICVRDHSGHYQYLQNIGQEQFDWLSLVIGPWDTLVV